MRYVSLNGDTLLGDCRQIMTKRNEWLITARLMSCFWLVHRLIGVCQQAVDGGVFRRVIFDLPDAEFNVVAALFLQVACQSGTMCPVNCPWG